MNETLQGVLATVAGFAISRLFDYLNLGKTHTLALKKEYFMRKLNSFEKATAYYTIGQNSIMVMSHIYNQMTNDDIDFPEPVISRMLQDLNDNLNTVQRATQESALALGLYTDYKFSDEANLLGSRYLDVLGQMTLTAQVLKLIKDQQENAFPQESARLDRFFDDEMEKLGNLITELAAISDRMKAVHTGVVTHLRGQMRQYEHSNK